MSGCADVLPIKLPDAGLSEPVCSPPLCSRCAPAVSVKSDARCSNGPLWVPYLAFSLCDSVKFFFFFSSPQAFIQPAHSRAPPRWRAAVHKLLVWFSVGAISPLFQLRGEKVQLLDTLPLPFSVLAVSLTEAGPFSWELVHALDNRRPAGVGSDSVIFILTFPRFLLAISDVKTLQSWPHPPLPALTNQAINSSQKWSNLPLLCLWQVLKSHNLHLIATARKHLNRQKGAVLIFHGGEQPCETTLPLTFQCDNTPPTPNHTHNFYFLFSKIKKRRKWLARLNAL